MTKPKPKCKHCGAIIEFNNTFGPEWVHVWQGKWESLWCHEDGKLDGDLLDTKAEPID